MYMYHIHIQLLKYKPIKFINSIPLPPPAVITMLQQSLEHTSGNLSHNINVLQL